MSDFKNKIQIIIQEYCEGINHLEFNITDFPEMLERIEKEAINLIKNDKTKIS